MGFSEIADGIEGNGKVIFITSLVMLFFVILVSMIVFFTSVKTADQVLVPNIEGKRLEDAMLELQVKELYPRLQLKFSDNTEDKGIVLEQNPPAGTIVKAGKRINLVVSRGAVIDRIENFVGKTLSDVQNHLASLFTAGHKQLIIIKEPVIYKNSAVPAGTILEQNPPADTEISEGMEIELVVSKGPENEKVSVPNLENKNLNELYSAMAKYKLNFKIKTESDTSLKEATVVSQNVEADTTVEAFSELEVLIKLPQNTEKTIYGIYSPLLPKYPYPIKVVLDAVYLDGKREELVNFKHSGGKITLPYALPEGTVLILTVLNKQVQTVEVKANKQ